MPDNVFHIFFRAVSKCTSNSMSPIVNITIYFINNSYNYSINPDKVKKRK